MIKKLNIVVIFGGKSTEHDISILTALQIINAIDLNKYNVTPVYISHEGKWYIGNSLRNIEFYKNTETKALKEVAIFPGQKNIYIKKFNRYKLYREIDCAIIACHGKNGEDGSIQGLLELCSIPYSSSGILGSAIGLDKLTMKRLFQSINVPICEYERISSELYNKIGVAELIKKIKFPVVVKPNKLGSSIGISYCKNKKQLIEALKLVFIFDDIALVERAIKNLKEINISVLGNSEGAVCSSTEEIINKGFLSFEKKYLPEGIKNGMKTGIENTSRIIPGRLTKTQTEFIENISINIFKKFQCKGIVRIDFMIDLDTQNIFCNEINTIPGSFAYYLWKAKGIEFNQLLDRIIYIAIKDNKRELQLTTTFLSSVLTGGSIDK